MISLSELGTQQAADRQCSCDMQREETELHEGHEARAMVEVTEQVDVKEEDEQEMDEVLEFDPVSDLWVWRVVGREERGVGRVARETCGELAGLPRILLPCLVRSLASPVRRVLSHARTLLSWLGVIGEFNSLVEYFITFYFFRVKT